MCLFVGRLAGMAVPISPPSRERWTPLARRTLSSCARRWRRSGALLRAAFSPLREGDAPLGGGPHGLEGLQEGRALHQGLLLRQTRSHGSAAGEGERPAVWGSPLLQAPSW